MKKIIFFLIFISWFITLFFWFSNVDLSYFKGYIDFDNPISKFNLLEIVRGHVFPQFITYILFGVHPRAYYLVAIVIHSVVIIFIYKIFVSVFKDKVYSLFLALLIGINISYSNALFEGAFNQYYPILLFLFVSSVYFISLNKKIYLVFLLFGFFIRETILVLPLILLLYYLLFKFKYFSKNEIGKFVRFLLPIVFLTFLYLLIRKYVLGDLHSDLTDDAVQTRIAFMQSHRYIQLLVLMFINFFRMFAEQTLTYPIVNIVRDLTLPFFRVPIIPKNVESSLFVSLLGLVLFLVLSLFVLAYIKSNKNKNIYKKYLLFGFLWLILFNLFISFVLPFPLYIWENKYTFFSVITRYNYYSVFGLYLVLGILLKKYSNNKNFILAVLLILAYNFTLIQIGGFTLIKKKHKSAFSFYNIVFEKYKTFPNETSIYYNFFRVNNLRDYIGDLIYIYGPINYKNTNFFRESTLSNIQNEIKNGNIEIENIYAFDLIEETGEIVDLTNDTRELLNNLDIEFLKKDQNKDNVFYPSNQDPYVAKYLLEFDARYVGTNNLKCDSSFDDYWVKRFDYLNNTQIKSASRYGDERRFYYINAQKLIDNRINLDSLWQGGLINEKDEIIFDLGFEKEVNGIGWISNGQNANPTRYKYYSSLDAENWQEILEINDNVLSSKIDRFKTIKTRYIKVEIIATKLGQPALFYEIEILNYPSNLNKYNSFYELLTNSYQACLYNQRFSNGIVVYSSNKSSFEFPFFLEKTNYYKNYKIEIYAIEAYVQSKYLLNENIDNILINTFNYDYDIKNVKLIPWHKVN